MAHDSFGVFGQHAEDYFAFRPQYPEALFDWLRGIVRSGEFAWDCGTGSGQAAVGLAGKFKRVLATDPDRRQLALAPFRPNIDYRVARAEEDLGLRGELDLITCACSIHWFDIEKFYENVKLVLSEQGVIAAWTYDWPWTHSEPVNKVLNKLKTDILGSFWGKNSNYYFQQYRNLPFPFTEIECPTFCVPVAQSKCDLLDFLRTWSATRKYHRQMKADPLALIARELESAWVSEPPELPLRIPLHMRVGRLDRSC